MVPDVSTGDRTRGLLSYLFGPGRRNEHTDPHIVAAFALPGLPDPGRVPLDEHQAALSELARYLDHQSSCAGSAPARKCRSTCGTAPSAPPPATATSPTPNGPRSPAASSTPPASPSTATTPPAGGSPYGTPRTTSTSWPPASARTAAGHATSATDSAPRAECRTIETELGLRRLKSGDATAPKTPTGAEVGQGRTPRPPPDSRGSGCASTPTPPQPPPPTRTSTSPSSPHWASRSDTASAPRPVRPPATASPLRATPTPRANPSSTAAPHWPPTYPLTDSANASHPPMINNPGSERHRRRKADGAWRRAEAELRTTHAFLHQPAYRRGRDAQVQAQAAAFAELLHNTAATAPRTTRDELHAAATSFDRANRSAIRAEHQSAYALRQAGKELVRAAGGERRRGDRAAVHRGPGHDRPVPLVRTARVPAAGRRRRPVPQPPPSRLPAHRPPHPDPPRRPCSRARRVPTSRRRVQAVIPEHAGRILADPSWPALATALAQAESAGVAPRRALTAAAGQRELDTADRPAEVLIWRLRNATADRISTRALAATARTTTRRTPSAASAL